MTTVKMLKTCAFENPLKTLYRLACTWGKMDMRKTNTWYLRISETSD